jgi:hypothetical protein
MEIQLEINKFIDEIENSKVWMFYFPTEIKQLLQIAVKMERMSEFEELISLSKSLIKVQEIIKRIGPAAEGYNKLEVEYHKGVKEVNTLLHTLIITSEIEKEFESKFLADNSESYAHLMIFLSDLSWIKNWQIDGKPLPCKLNTSTITDSYTERKLRSSTEQMGDKTYLQLSQIKRSAVLIAILFFILLVIDSPVTIFGWILTLAIIALITYIIIQIYIINRYAIKNRVN